MASGARSGSRPGWLWPALVFAVAFAARLGMVYAHGGTLRDGPSYDTSVYYAAADALVHGRVPYRDFTLLHPPGMMLAITPFAALGRLTTDHTGFVVGNLAWMALGAVNALLIMRIGRHLRFGTAASLVGGLAYALWYESTRTEYALRLEPLGNFLVLIGVLAFVVSARSTSRLAPVCCGAALGAAATVKIWYVVPALIVLGWHLVERRPRRQLGWAGGAAITVSGAVCGPFLLLAGTRMWQLVVSDQVGRTRAGGTPIARLAQIASSGQIGASDATATQLAVTGIGALVFAAICVLARRNRAARLFPVLAIVQVLVVVIAPTFFPYYSDYLAPATALTLAAAAAALLAPDVTAQHRRLRLVAAWLPVVLVGGSAAAIDVIHPFNSVSPGPDRRLQQAVASVRCLQSDSPMALIQLDALSRDLAHHCPLWVDVTGRSYAAPLKPTGRINGRPLTRATYPPWQHALRTYLLAGDAVVIIQPAATGISPQTLRAVTRGPLLARSDGYAVHLTAPAR